MKSQKSNKNLNTVKIEQNLCKRTKKSAISVITNKSITVVVLLYTKINRNRP